MPIYEYRCSACGYQNDYLQKISDPVLSDCPNCGESTFAKQVTAAGFQLKGTGWYATDFKNNGKAKELYELFLEKYPEHDFADDAQFSLQYLGKSPEELMMEFEAQNADIPASD